jgi:hypothetical protein
MSATLRSLPPTETKPPADAGRWLVLTFIELAKRFLGMAVSAGFPEARQRHECPRCGNIWKS